MILRRYLEQRTRLINEALERYVPETSQPLEHLIEAMRYSLFAGGKRIRPILLLAAGETVGGDVQSMLPFACAIELIHTYSLIHDDLPALDNDALRRGKPASHVVFGDGLAILAGDALLTEAFRLMAAEAGSGMRARRTLRCIGEIADAAGAAGMIGGQAADLKAEGKVPDLPTVEFIHVRKTGALLLSSVRCGAILSGARPHQLRRLTRYGEFLGLAFQVADDILDSEGDIAVTGKMQGRDRARGKMTYPAVLGLPSAKERAWDLLGAALDALQDFSGAADPLREIARFIVTRACGGKEVRRPPKACAHRGMTARRSGKRKRKGSPRDDSRG